MSGQPPQDEQRKPAVDVNAFRKKLRESEVGAAFLREYNSQMGASFVDDPSHFEHEADPTPDLGFRDGEARLFAEVITLSGGEEALRLDARRTLLCGTLQAELNARAPSGLFIIIEPKTELLQNVKEFRLVVGSLVAYAIRKAEHLKNRAVYLSEEEEGAYLPLLRPWLRNMLIRQTGKAKSWCGVSTGAHDLRPKNWVQEAIERKAVAQYGSCVHLLLDNRALGVDAEDVRRFASPIARPPGFEGVWFVDVESGEVMRLDEADGLNRGESPRSSPTTPDAGIDSPRSGEA